MNAADKEHAQNIQVENLDKTYLYIRYFHVIDLQNLSFVKHTNLSNRMQQ